MWKFAGPSFFIKDKLHDKTQEIVARSRDATKASA